LVRAVVGDIVESLFQDGQLSTDHPTVGFELRLARTPEADTTPDT